MLTEIKSGTERVGTQFETMTCSRCGGSGHYSYCQRYGTTCFKCAGAGRVFTKRGAAAQAFYTNLLSKRAADLLPGDKVRETVVTNGGELGSKWMAVLEVYPQTAERNGGCHSIDPVTNAPVYSGLVVELDGLVSCGVPADHMYRVAATAEVKQAAKAKALEYQETLAKTGTPRKR